MRTLRRLSFLAAVVITQHAHAGGSDNCVAQAAWKVACRVPIFVRGEGTNASPCKVSGMPSFDVGRNETSTSGARQPTVLVFVLVGHKDLAFDGDGVTITPRGGGVITDHFEPVPINDAKRAIVFLDKNPSEKFFDYTVTIKNVQTGNPCSAPDPVIHNTN